MGVFESIRRRSLSIKSFATKNSSRTSSGSSAFSVSAPGSASVSRTTTPYPISRQDKLDALLAEAISPSPNPSTFGLSPTSPILNSPSTPSAGVGGGVGRDRHPDGISRTSTRFSLPPPTSRSRASSKSYPSQNQSGFARRSTSPGISSTYARIDSPKDGAQDVRRAKDTPIESDGNAPSNFRQFLDQAKKDNPRYRQRKLRPQAAFEGGDEGAGPSYNFFMERRRVK